MTYNNCDDRTIALAYFILDNQSTIRATAKEFGIAKSTVHHDLSIKLKYLNYSLFRQVKKLLDENFETKHIHGGESTRQKFLALRQEIDPNDEVEVSCY